VVGPRPLTYLGSQNLSGVAMPATQYWAGNSSQYIQLGLSSSGPTDAVMVYDTTGTKTSRTSTGAATADMQQPLPIICDKPDPSSALTYRIGMNISEPMITSAGPDGITYYSPPIATFPTIATQMTNNQGNPSPLSTA